MAKPQKGPKPSRRQVPDADLSPGVAGIPAVLTLGQISANPAKLRINQLTGWLYWFIILVHYTDYTGGL